MQMILLDQSIDLIPLTERLRWEHGFYNDSIGKPENLKQRLSRPVTEHVDVKIDIAAGKKKFKIFAVPSVNVPRNDRLSFLTANRSQFSAIECEESERVIRSLEDEGYYPKVRQRNDVAMACWILLGMFTFIMIFMFSLVQIIDLRLRTASFVVTVLSICVILVKLLD